MSSLVIRRMSAPFQCGTLGDTKADSHIGQYHQTGWYVFGRGKPRFICRDTFPKDVAMEMAHRSFGLVLSKSK